VVSVVWGGICVCLGSVSVAVQGKPRVGISIIQTGQTR